MQTRLALALAAYLAARRSFDSAQNRATLAQRDAERAVPSQYQAARAVALSLARIAAERQGKIAPAFAELEAARAEAAALGL